MRVDWDGDGDDDLLLGGYVTGLLFLYENIGTDARHRPLLEPRGPVEADGAPLDTGWQAAPAVADLDADGDLDLVCGSMPVASPGGESDDPVRNLVFYENVGTRAAPRLTRRRLPWRGEARLDRDDHSHDCGLGCRRTA